MNPVKFFRVRDLRAGPPATRTPRRPRYPADSAIGRVLAAFRHLSKGGRAVSGKVASKLAGYDSGTMSIYLLHLANDGHLEVLDDDHYRLIR